MPIKVKRHIKKALSPQVLKKKVILLEFRLVNQASQIQRQKQKITKLRGDKKTLVEEVRSHKWDHILTKRELTRAKHNLEDAHKEISALKEALRIARLPKNSSNSSRPPSTDLFIQKRNTNYSLRSKTGRKPGGQPGHEGSTLEFCTDAPDHQIDHTLEKCIACGKDLSAITGERGPTHQIVDIAIPKRVLINHTIIKKHCSCGKCNEASFPEGARGPVNYGNRLRGLIANLSVRQYMPYKRTIEFMEDIFGIPMSEGTVTNLLAQFERSARKSYKHIHDQVLQSPVVGADETNARVNGSKNWFHTYQTPQYTFIGYHPSRGIQAQEAFYPGGLSNSILVTDCLAMQLSTPAAAHQVCHAHLARELKAFEEAHPEECWPAKINDLFRNALDLKNYPYCNKRIQALEKKFKRLMESDQSNAPGKIKAFWKRMNTHSDKLFTFLHFPEVPSDNNGSERAIRCIKVKQKVSGQFKTPKGAHQYAIIRSIIDTMIKQNKNVHEGLARIASFTPD